MKRKSIKQDKHLTNPKISVADLNFNETKLHSFFSLHPKSLGNVIF
jgi:hypothetical protein